MTILFMGGEMGSFFPSDSGVIEASSGFAVPSFDSAFARCAIQCGNNQSSYAESFAWASQTAVYVHFEHDISTTGTTANVPIVTLYDGTTASVRVTHTATTTYKLEYLNASAVFTSIGTATINGRTAFDIFVDVTNGILRLYAAGTKRLEATGLSLGHITGISKLRVNANNYASYSQVIAADESTIGWRLKTVPATGAGATGDWVGGSTEVDEIAYSDADFVNSATANQIELFAHSTTIPAGYSVRAVGVTARAKCGATGPQNLQLALRSASTNYFSSSQLLDAGYGPFINIWENDPATSAPFTSSAIATLQFGLKSIA